MIQPTRFDKEMFQHYRLYIPQEDADEIRASELLVNHNRRISLQRSAMDERQRNEMKHTILSTELREKLQDSGPKTIKLTMPNGEKIGEAVVQYKDGIFHVIQITMDGSAAVVFGIDLKLISFSPSPLGPLHDRETYVEASSEDDETTDIKNTEQEN